MYFEPNRGQVPDNEVEFVSHGWGFTLELTKTGMVLGTWKSQVEKQISNTGFHTSAEALSVVKMNFVGANPEAAGEGLDQLPGKSNYFYGNDSKTWHTDIPNYAKVRYKEIYSGVDLVYYSNQKQLEYDFVVAPGADPEAICLSFEGTDNIEIDELGDLTIQADGDKVILKAPAIYQMNGNTRENISGRYAQKDTAAFGFELAAYDADRPLIIDPVALVYSTLLGGDVVDVGEAIRLDAAGNIYVAGWTSSANFPVMSSIQPTFAGVFDVFVTKLDPTGSTLLFSTYLGGSEDDRAHDIAIDAAGNIYLTGETASSDFPTENAFQPENSCGFACDGDIDDAFVTKLNSAGNALIYSTYIGGFGGIDHHDRGFGIAVDGEGNAYVTGETFTDDFPVTAGAYIPRKFEGFSFSGRADAFVTKFSPAGDTLYSTFLGQFSVNFEGLNETDDDIDDRGYDIAVDSEGQAYVVGRTAGDDFPTSDGALQQISGGGLDIFVSVLNPEGSDLVASSYLGGSSTDEGHGIALDNLGNVYVTGFTNSEDFPVSPGAAQDTLSNADCAVGFDANGNVTSTRKCYDAFVAKMNPSLSSSLYVSYLGGGREDQPTREMPSVGEDLGNDIAVDQRSHAFLTGVTQSPLFPVQEGFQDTLAGPTDAFVARFDETGKRLYSTYLGGSTGFGGDTGYGIAVDAGGNAWVTGVTAAPDFPLKSPYDSTFTGVNEAFVAKIGGGGLQVVVDPPVLKAGQSSAIRVRILDQDGNIDTEFFSNVRFKIVGDKNGNGVREIANKESTEGIGRLNTMISLIDEGVSENIFLFTPEEQFTPSRPIDDQTVISGTAFIAVEVEDPVMRDTIRVDVKSPLDIFIEDIEVQQGVVDLGKAVEQEFQPGEDRVFPALPFIAEHQTAIRVSVKFETLVPFSKVEITGIQGELRISGPGGTQAPVTFKSALDTDFKLRDRDYSPQDTVRLRHGLFTIVEPEKLRSPGEYTFEVTLKLDPRLHEIPGETANNMKDTTWTFVETNPFKVLAVIGLFEESKAPDLEEGILGPFDLVEKAYPVQRSKLEHTDPNSVQPWMLNNTFTRFYTYGQLHYRFSLYNRENATQYEKMVIFTDYAGLQNLCPGTGGCVPNPAFGKYGIVFGNSPSGVAHELGHTLGLGDTYDESTRGTPVAFDSNPRRSDAIGNGNLVDIGNMVLLPELQDPDILVTESHRVTDFMGGMGTWIDRTTWDHLYNTKFKQSAANQSSTESASDFLIVSGAISDDGSVFLNPFLRVPQVPEVSTPGNGEYALELLGQDGVLLNSFQFDLEFMVPDLGAVSEVPFAIELPFPAETREIAISKNGTQLISRALSENPPEVQFTFPVSGGEISGVTTLSWVGSDPDGDDLTYSIFYSADGSEQMVVDVNLTESSYDWNSSFYPASQGGSITVVANDGINEGRATISNVTIDPGPTLNPPADLTATALGDTVLLSWSSPTPGSGIDLQSFNVYRASISSPRFTGPVIANVDASVTTYRDMMPGAQSQYYQVTAVYEQGESTPSNEASILVTSIESSVDPIPESFALHQNYPNPFNPETRIEFDLPNAARVRIDIFNLLGQRIKTLVDERKEAGRFSIVWDGRDENGRQVASGIYVYTLKSEQYVRSKKLLLLK